MDEIYDLKVISDNFDAIDDKIKILESCEPTAEVADELTQLRRRKESLMADFNDACDWLVSEAQALAAYGAY